MLQAWELLVLSKLQWNAASITGFDYVDQISERFSWGSESSYLRRHAHTLVAICYTGKFKVVGFFLLCSNSLLFMLLIYMFYLHSVIRYVLFAKLAQI